MDGRQRKVGENEVLYRSVNERIEELNATFGTTTDSLTVVCECGRAVCTEQIDLPASDYERVRADPALFIIIPGHEIPDVEDVVETQERFDVVRKHPGGPADLAREVDPRS